MAARSNLIGASRAAVSEATDAIPGIEGLTVQYILNLLILIEIQMLLAMSLSLIVGHLGLVSLCHAIFFAIGAYTLGLLTTELKVPFTLAAALGVALATIAGWLFAALSGRTKGDDFVLLTLAVQLIFSSILLNWREVTKGPFGVFGIQLPSWLRIFESEITGFAALLTGTAVFLCCGVTRVMYSPLGRTLRAIRDDEIVAMSFGKRVSRLRRTVYAFSAAIAGLAGVFYASYIGYIDPGSFTVFQSMALLVVLIVGGTGNVLGAVVGATFVILLPELLFLFAFTETAAAELRQFLYGLAVVLLMLFRPRGIAGRFAVGAK
jgi:branched-chain amino acid transport system permease protein